MNDTPAPASPEKTPVPWNKLLNYAAGGVIMASMFALVITGKVGADAYWTLAVAALGGLGVHVTTTAGK